MSTTYRLKANELDQNFLEKLKIIYQGREIQITIDDLSTELEIMANDPCIQAEIRKIDEKFNVTLMDGLHNYE